MEAITFSMLSATACAFLIYVLVNFHRELVRIEKRAGTSEPIHISSREAEPALPVVLQYVRKVRQRKV